MDRLPTIPMERHPLMKGRNTDYFEKEKDRHKIASELGLKNQVTHSILNVYQQDIEKLTDSKDYVQISDATLKNLFGIGKLKAKAFGNNIGRFFNSNAKWPLLAGVGAIGGLVLAAGFPSMSPFLGIPLAVIILLLIVTCVGSLIQYSVDGKFTFEFISVELKKEPIERTIIKLPYGALLKLKEAKESNIFKDFIIASPEVKTEEYTIRILGNDPAILGITEDARQYLICYWDIKGDFDRAEAQIERLKKLKIEE